eukprot:g21897.t1
MPHNRGEEIARAAGILRNGGLVAIPTETVYGLGANALDETAVARVFEAKNRPRFDPLIVHVADTSALDALVHSIPRAAKQLMERFWPGPLTLVLPKHSIVPDLVTAGLDTVAIRIPDHPLTLELIREAGVPVAAPSANPFGCISPTTAAHVIEQLGDKIDGILDGGPCRIGVESTVVQIVDDPTPSSTSVVLLRPGGVSVEEMEAVAGPVTTINTTDGGNDDRPQTAPGMLSRHYAPATPLLVQAQPAAPTNDTRCGLLTFRPHEHADRFTTVETLSETGDLAEAAARFFAALRRLDSEKLDRIIATPFPEAGLGRALNDRLRRALFLQGRTSTMKVAVASDHRGYELKAKILDQLEDLGHEGIDYGPDGSGSVDYPDYAAKVARAIGQGEAERGILICGTGIGMCITANKFPGVRAAACHDDLTVRMSRQHNDTNVLCLSGDLLGDRLVNRMLELWFDTEFEGGRHGRRVDKIGEYDRATDPNAS